METQTLGIHQGTYDAVFQHPISRNLQWRDVRSMLTALSDTAEENPGGNVKFTRNGQTLTVHPPRRKDFSDVQGLMDIRHFLQRSDEPSRAGIADGVHLLVVIDHREARIFTTELHRSAPQRVTPVDPQRGAPLTATPNFANAACGVGESRSADRSTEVAGPFPPIAPRVR